MMQYYILAVFMIPNKLKHLEIALFVKGAAF